MNCLIYCFTQKYKGAEAFGDIITGRKQWVWMTISNYNSAASAACIISNNAAHLSNYLLNNTTSLLILFSMKLFNTKVEYIISIL